MNANRQTIESAKQRAMEIFQHLLGEVSVGVTKRDDDRLGLKINVFSQTNFDPRELPSEVDGVPVEIVYVGRTKKG